MNNNTESPKKIGKNKNNGSIINDRDDNPVVQTFEDAQGHVFYADKISSKGSLLFSKAKVIYTSGHYIDIDDIRCYHYYYSSKYSGDLSTEITNKRIDVSHGKKKVYIEQYEKHAGPSWDDYAEVMESEDEETCYITTMDEKYNVDFDRDVWKWLEDYFPTEE